MDHATAMRKAIAESYALGELSEEERAEFEEHFFTCETCADDVRALAIFIEDTRRALGRPMTGRHPSSTTQKPQGRQRLLMLPIAAGVLLALGGAIYQTAVTVPQLRQDLARTRALQATSWHFLSVARSDPAQIRVVAKQSMIGLTLSRTGYESSARYLIRVRDGNGAVTLTSAVAAPTAGDELQLLLPVSELEAGRYTVELSGIDSTEELVAPGEVTKYTFILTREEK